MASLKDKEKRSGAAAAAEEFDVAAQNADGISISELREAQLAIQATIIPGHEAYETAQQEGGLLVTLMQRGDERLVGFATSWQKTRLGDLTPDQFGAASFDLSTIRELQAYRQRYNLTNESPVTYALLDPRQHKVVRGNPYEDNVAVLLENPFPRHRLN